MNFMSISLIKINSQILFIYRKINVRGLCELAIYDRTYHFNIGEDGNILFLGEVYSIIVHDKVTN